VFFKRWRRGELLPSKFSLDRPGVWINGMAVLWLLNAIVFAFFPTYPHPTPDLIIRNVLV
jgi:choline transport protein